MYQTGFKFQLFHLNPSMLLHLFQLPFYFFPLLKLGIVIAPASKRKGSSEIMQANPSAQCLPSSQRSKNVSRHYYPFIHELIPCQHKGFFFKSFVKESMENFNHTVA